MGGQWEDPTVPGVLQTETDPCLTNHRGGKKDKTKLKLMNEWTETNRFTQLGKKRRNQKMGMGEGERRTLGLMLDHLFHKTDHQSETAGLTGKLYGALDNNRRDIRIWINQYKKQQSSTQNWYMEEWIKVLQRNRYRIKHPALEKWKWF